MLSATELASMQATAASSLDIPGCQVQRNTPTDDIWGSQVESWATIATCAMRFATPNTPLLAALAARIGALIVWRISLPLTVDVRAGDRIVSGGDTFAVHAVETPQSYATVNQVLAAEVR